MGYPPEYLDDTEDEEDEEVEDEEYSDIEGCTEPDVGWCKLRAAELYPGTFHDLCTPDWWYNFYIRPPAYVGYSRGMSYDGF